MMMAVGLKAFAALLLLSSTAFAGVTSNTSPCPAKPLATKACTQVQDWNELRQVVTQSNDTVVLCPFEIQKTDDDPILLQNQTRVFCQKTVDTDECAIRGAGIHIMSKSEQEVVVVGLTFRESDEHAVYIQSSIPTNTHTFCECTFEENRHVSGRRGGAFLTEKETGRINVIGCTFRDNYCDSYGGALYTRSNFMNIVGCSFIGNIALGLGGAILAAFYADISISDCLFSGNRGEGTFAIVIKPVSGPMMAIDGGDNISIDNGDCDGFYDWSEQTCIEFSGAPTSLVPTTTAIPSMLPSSSPSVLPSLSPTTSEPTVSLAPSLPPSSAPSQSPSVSIAPSASPSISMAPTSIAYSLCGDPSQYLDEECVSVDTWSEFHSAISNATDHIVFCPITIQNDNGQPVVVDKNIQVYCPTNSCVIFGTGTHVRVLGDTQTLFTGFTFTGSNQTAIQIRTESYSSVTTFCKCGFNNNRRFDDGGGVMRTTEDTGEVNVVACVFYNNAGKFGGAIFSRAFRLNLLDNNITTNVATDSGSSIFVSSQGHLLARGNVFSRNRASAEDYSIIVLPSVGNETRAVGTFVDAGDNVVVDDGLCSGFYAKATGECHKFLAGPAAPSLVYPYVPGELSVYDSDCGLLMSSGLSARVLARTGEPVAFGSDVASQNASSLPFHREPDGAAVVPTEDGGWWYVSNSEQSIIQPVKGSGGVYAVKFDSDGEIRDYRALLTNTTRNCNGGLTPWNTWVSCEETAGGQCWQIHPTNLNRLPEPTSIGEAEGGSFEAFTYDIRNASRPCFFVTEDHERGALRRWCPDSYLLGGDKWQQLHGNGTRTYLKFINGTNNFEWTPSLEEGRQSAQLYFPFTEGISHDGNGMLYFTSKKMKALFACNLDTMEYRITMTNDKENMLGDGIFNAEPDHVILGRNTDMLYFTEDGEFPGVHGLEKSTGKYLTILEAVDLKYKHDELTGLAWSPDWTRMYICIQDYGVLFEITRDDGLPFEHDETQLQLRTHSDKRRRKRRNGV